MIERKPGDKLMTPHGYGMIQRIVTGSPVPFEIYQFEEQIGRLWSEEHIFDLPAGTWPGRAMVIRSCP